MNGRRVGAVLLGEDRRDMDDFGEGTLNSFAFKKHAQDGRGIERPAERASVFLPSLAERSRALCALNGAAREVAAACEDEFAGLVKRQSQFVFRVAFSVLRNVQDAEDVVQETFLKIYRLGVWTNMQDERAFLARAAWRLAVGRIRRVAGQQLREEAVDGVPSAEANLIRADSEAALHRLVDALPLELRLPLALSTVDGMTSPEIAKVMGIPEGTVRGRLLRARGILKRKLQEAEVRRG